MGDIGRPEFSVSGAITAAGTIELEAKPGAHGYIVVTAIWAQHSAGAAAEGLEFGFTIAGGGFSVIATHTTTNAPGTAPLVLAPIRALGPLGAGVGVRKITGSTSTIDYHIEGYRTSQP